MGFSDIIKLLYGIAMKQPYVETRIAGTGGLGIAWLERELGEDRDKYDLYIIAGELSLASAPESFFRALKGALGRGKNVWIFCGPRIMISDKSDRDGGSNRIIDLIKEYEPGSNLHILYIEDVKAAPPFHFCLCGENVIIEKPHLPNADWKALEVVPIRDSVLWRYRLRKYLDVLFKDKRIRVVRSIGDVEPHFEDAQGLSAYSKKLIKDGWYDDFPDFLREKDVRALLA